MKKWLRRIFFLVVAVFALIGLKDCFRESPIAGKGIGVLAVEGTFWIADEWLQQIEEFRKDDNIAAVVVRIHSPGGTVAAAQEIYDALKKLSAVKPVVASMGTVAASGGVYIAMGANKIVANPGTLTGSIGVRMEHLNLGDFLRMFKIEYETIKSGRLKDMGGINRPLTPEEKGLLEGMLAEIHSQFKGVVATERKLKPEAVEQFADGRIFTGTQAQKLGLVDILGSFDTAVGLAQEMAGLQGEPRLVYPSEPYSFWLRALLGEVRLTMAGPLACFL